MLTRDAEIAALEDITGILSGLPEDARSRVVEYLGDRYVAFLEKKEAQLGPLRFGVPGAPGPKLVIRTNQPD